MKKKIFAAILAGGLLVGANAMAGDYTNGSAGSSITVGGTSDPATLTFTPSPGVLMNVYTSADAFSLNAANTKAKDDAIEYLMLSSKAGYYQKEATYSSGTVSLTDLTSTDQSTTGYTYIGGGS